MTLPTQATRLMGSFVLSVLVTLMTVRLFTLQTRTLVFELSSIECPSPLR